VPFDRRRSGMILGAGAVGLSLKKSRMWLKGHERICRILGTHAFNTADIRQGLTATDLPLSLTNS